MPPSGTVLDLETGRWEARPSTMCKLAAALGVATTEGGEFDGDDERSSLS